MMIELDDVDVIHHAVDRDLPHHLLLEILHVHPFLGDVLVLIDGLQSETLIRGPVSDLVDSSKASLPDGWSSVKHDGWLPRTVYQE